MNVLRGKSDKGDLNGETWKINVNVKREKLSMYLEKSALFA